MTTIKSNTVNYRFTTPGCLTLTQPIAPYHFSRIIYASIHGLQTVIDPHYTFAQLVIIQGHTTIYSVSASFRPDMRINFNLMDIPNNVPPILDFDHGAITYDVQVIVRIPCQVSFRLQNT